MSGIYKNEALKYDEMQQKNKQDPLKIQTVFISDDNNKNNQLNLSRQKKATKKCTERANKQVQATYHSERCSCKLRQLA